MFQSQAISWRFDTQHNDTQSNDTQHYGTQYNDTQQNDTRYNDIGIMSPTIMALSQWHSA